MNLVDGALNIFSLSLIFALISFSVYLTTSIMKVTDITCDTCITLGGCTYGALVLSGINPIAAFICATICGITAGFIVSFITNHIRAEIVLSSVITISILQTFIIKLNSFGNVIRSTLHKSGIGCLSNITPATNAVVITIFVLIFAFLFFKFLNSEYGLAMRVYGDGIIVSESLGIDTKQVLCIGLGLANGIAAGSGALLTQVLGDFSSTMGTGSLVFGIASVIIGEKLLEVNSIKAAIISCFIGSIVYKIAIEIFTSLGSSTVGSEYNSIIIAIVLIFLMVGINDQRKQGNLENF